MHTGAVVPTEERLPGLGLPLDEVDCSSRSLIIDRFHSLLGERTGILDGLLPNSPPAWMFSGIVLIRGLGPKYAARPEHFLELVARVGPLFRLFVGVQVVEVAEELVEPVHGRQVLVPVPEVVLPELSGGVTMVL